MSGWIKFEKDLANDPRVLRMAKELSKIWYFASADACFDGVINARNANALPGVTLVCGALARLWIYADSHAREDNTLDLGASEIDELLGIPNFCSLMPSDWLREIDENTVELPGFQEHNGVEAKKKALTQKRVERHRGKQKLNGVTPRNAAALPDQDQTKTNKDSAAEPLVLHESLPAEAWEEWLAHRREKRWSLSPRALKPQLKLLSKFPTQAQREIIETSMQAGWQGLFPPKGAPTSAKSDPFQGAH